MQRRNVLLNWVKLFQKCFKVFLVAAAASRCRDFRCHLKHITTIDLLPFDAVQTNRLNCWFSLAFQVRRTKTKKKNKSSSIFTDFCYVCKKWIFSGLTVSNIDSYINKRIKFSIYLDIIWVFLFVLKQFSHKPNNFWNCVMPERFVCVFHRYLVESEENLIESIYQTVYWIYAIVCDVAHTHTHSTQFEYVSSIHFVSTQIETHNFYQICKHTF